MGKEKRRQEVERVSLGLPAAVSRWVPERPWLKVQVTDAPWVEHAGRRRPLEAIPVSPLMPGAQLATLARAMSARGGRERGLFVSQRLNGAARTILEGLGAAYVDGQGHLHLPLPGLLVHVDVAPQVVEANARPRGLGPSGVRAVQALLATTETVPLGELASRTRLSLSQTHVVLRILEEAGLVRAAGRGPARRRTVVDRSAVLDWLAGQASARRREQKLEVALYARGPRELWKQLSERLGRQGVSHALTGLAGASLYGVGPTSVPMTSVRISPEVSLERAASALGAEPTHRGANVRLVRDTGQVGTVLRQEVGGAFVAPPVRVYLDALGELRGEDVAQHFREVRLGF